MFKFGFVAASLFIAAPALAQPQAAPAGGGEAAIQQAAMAFGQCVQTGVQGLASTVTPEAGATTVLGGCSTQKDSLLQALEAMINALPADQQTVAREQVRTQLAAAPGHIADAIRQHRAGAAAPAAPAH